MPIYTGQDQDRRYTGENADVSYSLKRCIHAEECITRLSQVFDPAKRPWIQPGNTSGDALTDMVGHCPSGALHVQRKDGGAPEAVPDVNRVTLWTDGPLQVNGDLAITASGVEITGETRVTLCRCGASKNKPFCDNSHKVTGFRANLGVNTQNPPTIAGTRPLHITAQANGSLRFSGPLRLINEAGEEVFSGESAYLCRCGGSSRKPFCDGTHKINGFQAE